MTHSKEELRVFSLDEMIASPREWFLLCDNPEMRVMNSGYVYLANTAEPRTQVIIIVKTKDGGVRNFYSSLPGGCGEFKRGDTFDIEWKQCQSFVLGDFKWSKEWYTRANIGAFNDTDKKQIAREVTYCFDRCFECVCNAGVL